MAHTEVCRQSKGATKTIFGNHAKTFPDTATSLHMKTFRIYIMFVKKRLSVFGHTKTYEMILSDAQIDKLSEEARDLAVHTWTRKR